MRQFKKIVKKLSIGDYTIKNTHLRRILRYCQIYFGESDVVLSPRGLITDFDSYPELEAYLKKVFKDNADNILWEYEGEYVFQRAMRLVGIRPRSEKEFHDFFVKNTDNLRSVDILEERILPFVDDTEFARYLVDKERHHNPKGNSVIKRKLQEKGIDDNIINEVLEISPDDQQELIRKQFVKHEKQVLRRAEKKGAKREMYFTMMMKTYLYSKGFRIDEIDTFLKQLK